jgi:DNA invertase Pin-like site-specific DNA recombinase
MAQHTHKGHHVGYIRVSSVDQNTARQLEGLELDRVFEDRVSGKDTKRPALQECLKYLRKGDTLVVHSPDRLARNVEDLLRIVRELTERGVGVEFHTGGLPSFEPGKDNPAGKLLLTVLGAVAEMERALIRERQREGVQLAKAAGKYKGRGKKLTEEQAVEVRRLAAERTPDGRPLHSRAGLAKRYGVSRQTLYQYIGE